MRSSLSVQKRPAKPVFIYDGECGFCSRWVALWKRVTEERVDFIPNQESPFSEIAGEDYRRSSQFVDTDGAVYSGAEAVFRMFRHAHGKGWWFWAFQHVRGFERISEFVYAKIAANRYAISRINRIFFPAEVPEYGGTRALFLRLLGVVYLCAFASLWPQIQGLIGAQGILPAADLMQAAQRELSGSMRWQILPTLCWYSASDTFLIAQCATGVGLAALLVLGVLPALLTPLLWLLWLSLTVVGQDFMAFQWENLLLEAGFLSIFLSPISLTAGRGERPPALVMFLFRWLIFRLMLMSGAVKLLSGDPAWSHFTALFYHYETQPLPTWFGWQSYQLPSWFLVLQTGIMYLIEIGFSFLVFARRKLRLTAFVGFVALQLGIALTGNYGYFNLLTMVLCVLLLDDRIIRRVKDRATPLRGWRNVLLTIRTFVFAPILVAIILVSAMQLLSMLGMNRNWSKPLLSLHATASPFRSINSYGLFAVMTKKRPEIILQGSQDGQNWKDYNFNYKPEALNRLPGFVAPHQPRLDWQMWFAALGSYEQNPWFTAFCLRILQGSPKVLELLANNPFPGKPPKFVRAVVWDYEFTTRAQRRESGNYWLRKNERIYLPAVSLGGSGPSRGQ